MERNKASSLKSDTFEIPREKKRSIQESKMEAEHISSPMKSTKKIAKPIDTSDNDAYEPFSENKVSYFSSSSSNNNQPILSEKELYRQHYSVLKNALQNSNVQKREPFIPPSDICGSQNPVIYQNNSYFIPKLGQYVESMVDHTHLLEKPEGRLEKELWRAYSKYGFLYMRGIMGRQLSTDAQHAVLGSLTEMQYTAGEEDDWKPRKKTGWTIEINSGQVIGGTYENDLISEKTGVSCDTAEMNDIWAGVGKLPSVQNLMHSEVMDALLYMLAKGKETEDGRICRALRFDSMYSWLRVKNKKEFTSPHADIYYFRKHTHMFDLEGDDDEDDDDNDEEDDDSDTNEKCIQKTHMAGHINKAISSSSSQSVDNNCICFICKEDLPKRRNKKQSNDDFLQCEECGRCMHLRCLFQDSDERRQVKDLSEREDWFCVDCNPRPVIGTAWIPLGDVDIDSGVLAVLLESQNLPGMKQKSSAKKNKNELPMSWFSKSKGLTWKTTDYQAGDIVLFDSLLLHSTSTNVTDKYRLSIDFRWMLQPQRNNIHSTWHGKVVAGVTTPI